MRCIVKSNDDKKNDTIRNGMDGGNTIAVIDGFRDGPLIRCFDLKSLFIGVMPNSSCCFRAVHNQIYSFSPQEVLPTSSASVIILAAPTFDMIKDYVNDSKEAALGMKINPHTYFSKHIFVVQDKNIKSDLQIFFQAYPDGIFTDVEPIFVLSTIHEQYGKRMTQARESLIQHSSSNIYDSNSQTTIFKYIQDYVGSAADEIRDQLLMRCIEISNQNKPTWYDKLEIILEQYITSQAKKHDNDKNKFYKTPCGQQAEKLLDAFNKAGQFYSDSEAARVAYNEFVEVINKMAKNKVFNSSANRILDDNALHQYLEKLVEALKPVKKDMYLFYRDGNGGSSGSGE